jgi:hypothetical protein
MPPTPVHDPRPQLDAPPQNAEKQRALTPSNHTGRTAADDTVRAEADTACCERWWTSCGTDHDTTCPRRVPKSSAA